MPDPARSSPDPTADGVVAERGPGQVMDNLLEGCQVIDRSWRYVYVNDALERHGRRTKRELLGRTMMEAYPGIQDAPVFSALRRCMEERSPQLLENLFTFPDGSTGWFELRVEPVPEGIVILSVEITERKRAEEALRRTLRAFRLLSDVNQAIVRATDETCLCERVCAIAAGTGGYPAAWFARCDAAASEAHLRLAARAVRGEDDPPRAPDAGWTHGPVALAARSGEPVLAQRAEDGELDTWWREAPARELMSCLALPLLEGGRVAGVFAIGSEEPEAFSGEERQLLSEMASDVSHGIAALRSRAARDSAERRVEARELEYRSLFTALSEGLLVAELVRDGSGSPADYRVLEVNPAFERHTGLAPLPGSLGSASFDLASRLDVIGRVAEAGEAASFEADLPSGRRVRVSVFSPARERVAFLVEDVTERRRTEEQVRSSQRLEAIGRLAGGVAHDFNNLLSVILGYARFAVDGLRAGDPLRDDMEEVRRAAERAAGLTKQLLAFSRKQVLNPRVVSMNTVLREMEPMLRRLVGEDLELKSFLAADLGNVKADPSQLEQVLMNLVVNARDAMPDGGQLTIETANADLDAGYAARHAGTEPGPHVMLSVSDTGCGMDEATQARLFEPFFTTKEPGKGTGLGLSTAYGIVRQSGGSIWVYSEVGKGTTFKVYLPRVFAATDSSPVLSVPPEESSETVLLVEDDDGVRALARRILSGAGFEVLCASNGGEALLCCERHAGEIHLLLTDVVMPLMSGRQLAERIEALRPGTKVLYMSGYTDDAIVHHGVLEPGTAFVSKPFSSGELVRKVREVLDASDAGTTT